MNIIKEWEKRLKYVEDELNEYKEILENNELNTDMRAFCLDKIKSVSRYKELIEKTLGHIKDEEGKRIKH